MTRAFAAAMMFAISIIPASHAAAAPKGIAVAYGDLDLGTTAGRGELTSRLRAAAGDLCGPVLARAPDSEPSVREHQVLYRACVGRLTQRAMAKVNIGRN